MLGKTKCAKRFGEKKKKILATHPFLKYSPYPPRVFFLHKQHYYQRHPHSNPRGLLDLITTSVLPRLVILTPLCLSALAAVARPDHQRSTLTALLPSLFQGANTAAQQHSCSAYTN